MMEEECVVQDGKIGEKMAPYNPTDRVAISIALGFLELRENEIVYDLGCGDGRFLIEACRARTSIRGIGVEYDASLVQKAIDAVALFGLQEQITIRHANILDIDFSDATVIFLYLVPSGIVKIVDKLIELLSRGVRIATYVFSLQGLQPLRVETFKGAVNIYLYGKESLITLQTEQTISA